VTISFPKSRNAQARAAQRKGRGGTRIGRTDVPAGHPESVSWRDLDWSEDDHCWLAVARHPDGLSHREIGKLMGYSKTLVEQIENRACRKLQALARTLPGGNIRDISPEWLATVLQRYDEHRAAERCKREQQAELEWEGEETGERSLTALGECARELSEESDNQV
jgi:transposase